MVSETDEIYIRKDSGINQGITLLGDGFESEEEIEEEIRERFGEQPGEYEYGTYETVSTVQISEPDPSTLPLNPNLDENEHAKAEAIVNRASKDSRVESSWVLDGKNRVTASIHQNNVRYFDGQADFAISLDTDIFDDVPLSTIDKDVANTMEAIFEDIVMGDGFYLGYDSNFASRGRQNPYVRLYGRVARENVIESNIRSLMNEPYIEGMFLTYDNITPIPLLYKNPNQKSEGDYIAVLPVIDQDDDLDDVKPDDLKEIREIGDRLENEYPFKASCVGKISFNRTYWHYYFGLDYTE